MSAELLFARYAPKTLEPKNSVGAKWARLLEQLNLASVVKDRRTVIKMHLGGGHGFSTIHPFFIRKLVDAVKKAGAAHVAVADLAGSVFSAAERGYTTETVGCPLVPVAGTYDKYYYSVPLTPPFLTMPAVQIAGEIADAEALIDFSHVKGHGCCAFGGACKNLAMGCVTQHTRGQLHALEGGLNWNAEVCTRCNICVENCPNKAMAFKDERLQVFYHDCKYCQHCALICPQKAIKMEGGRYVDFQKGLALTTQKILTPFHGGKALFINVLMDITIFCDCWGMTTPALVPDIGIVAGHDIVAVEQASLDLIRHEDLIPGSLPAHAKILKSGHLFHRVHGKDPYLLVKNLADLGLGHPAYQLQEIE